MAADFHARGLAPDEAFEGCLRAVQTIPLAQFQIGLAKLALLSGHLSSSQVFGAIKQAVQHAPHFPESHNLHGLVCEARFDYQSAAAAYRLARCAISSVSAIVPNSHTRDISLNLARSLCKAGNAQDALQECENLKKEGMLDTEGLQIYAFSLWQLGKCDLALSVVRSLAVNISTMKQTSVAAPVGFICRMLYFVSGVDSVISNILEMPKELFQNSGISFIVSAINALDQINRLESVVSSSRSVLSSHEEITGMHFLIALGKHTMHGTNLNVQQLHSDSTQPLTPCSGHMQESNTCTHAHMQHTDNRNWTHTCKQQNTLGETTLDPQPLKHAENMLESSMWFGQHSHADHSEAAAARKKLTHANHTHADHSEAAAAKRKKLTRCNHITHADQKSIRTPCSGHMF
ncbi:hypothetical protein I3842_01G085800 [Carya illinoinensis]|uniref:Uncharacterized protein n=1 Tax=Carya illinoinensis TaxID=32201 RepID=A0A922G3E6_CARIL|nr:hypothetical protein I3842_01G085800 [Carya illinoinensis]